MRWDFRKYLKADLVRNIGVLLSGAIIAQIIPVLITPVLSRIYSPSDFGTYSVFYGIVASVATLSSLRLDYAIVMQGNRSRAFHLFVASCLIAVGSTVAVFFVLVLLSSFAPSHQEFFGQGFDGRSVYLLLFLVAAVSWSIINNMTYYLNNLKNYRTIATNKTWRAVTISLSQIVASFMSYGGGGLIYGLVFGTFSSFVFLWIRMKANGLLAFQSFQAKFARALVVSNSRFAVYNAPHILVDMMLLHGLILLVSVFYSAEDVGNLGFVNRLIRIPASLIGSVVGNVLFQSLSEKIARRQSVRTEVQTAMKLMSLAVIPGLVLLPFIQSLFIILFGEQWGNAAEIATVLMPAMLINLVVVPFTNLAYSLNRNRAFFRLSMLNGSIIVIGCTIATITLDFEEFILNYAILQSASFMITGGWLWSLYREYEQKFAGNL